MVLVIITIYGKRHAVQYEVAGKGFDVQCMSQVPECRFFKPGALRSLEAYIMALAHDDQYTSSKGVYFTQGKAAYKRIKGKRYLEISLELLRKRAVKF